MRAARPQASLERFAYTALAVSVLTYLAMRLAGHPGSFDLAVYRAEGRAVLRGMDIYGPIGAPGNSLGTYPPFAALGFTPLATVPFGIAVAAVVLVNLGLLLAASTFSCRLARIPRARCLPAAAVTTAVLLWSEPVFTTLRYGQINLVLLVLVLWDCSLPPGSRRRGIGIGLAAALKVTPAIFIVHLVLTRRLRVAATATTVVAATMAVSVLVLPGATWRYWTRYLFDTTRVGRPENAENQSLRGVLVRLGHSLHLTDIASLLILLTAVAGLAVAARAHRLLGEEWGVVACAFTALLCAPVAWTHHWVWILPLAVVLVRDARTWLPLLIPFVTYSMWAVPHRRAVELHLSWPDQLLAAQYVLAGLGVLGCIAYRCRPGYLRTGVAHAPVSRAARGIPVHS